MRTLTRETTNKIDQTVQLNGWVHQRRDHGKLIFIDLRDRTGLMQIVFQPEQGDEAYQQAKKLHLEDVVRVEGQVVKRQSGMENDQIATGKIELLGQQLTILNRAEPIPFEINGEGEFNVNEETRLKYRYLDLRRPAMRERLVLRSRLANTTRQYFLEHDFVEVETPLFTKSTPEGSRDFIVPARTQPGKFYALPQSPQQYKQLLMSAGVERYFQIARCIRDEDLRADRGFEHTQIDMEMSFVEQEDVMNMMERLLIHLVKEVAPHKKIQQEPFPRYSYQEAMEQYGADKFDARKNPDDPDELAFAWVMNFPALTRDEETGKWTYEHNPFTGLPSRDADYVKSLDLNTLDEPEVEKRLAQLSSFQYDLVCNGYELGGGSVRIHDPELLARIFQIIGHDRDTVEEQFGHMLQAFKLGTPPHGGMALGLDRIAMIFANQPNIKEVIAFPQTGSGRTAVMDAPSEVAPGQLAELGISLAGSISDSALQQIQDLLDSKDIEYELIQHEAVTTSEQAAEVRGDELKQGAKALVMRTKEGTFFMTVISAASKLDSKKIRTAMGTKKTKFADKEDLKKLTGLEPGAVPPFGNLFQLKTIVDKRLLENEIVVFNAGSHTNSIRLKSKDLMRCIPAQIEDVCEA